MIKISETSCNLCLLIEITTVVYTNCTSLYFISTRNLHLGPVVQSPISANPGLTL